MLGPQIKLLEKKLALDKEDYSKPQLKRVRIALNKIYIMLLLQFIELNLPDDVLFSFYKDLDRIKTIVENSTETEKFFVKYLQAIPDMTIKLEAFFENHLTDIKYRLSQIIKNK